MECDVSALILVGGNSSRMGMKKYALNYFGISQVEFLQKTLLTLFENVYLSCNSDQQFELSRFGNLIIDNKKFGENGPFTAILSAFDKLKSPIFVIGCDYPYLGKTEIEGLLKSRDINCHATCFENETSGFYEPLITIYEFSSNELLLKQYDKNDFSLKRFLVKNNVRKIIPVNKNSLKSIDTTIEYHEVIREFSLNTNNK